MPAIFIVDDDDDMLYSLRSFFTKKNFGVKTFSSSQNLLDEISKDKPELVLLDVYLNGEDGRNICQDIKTATHYPIKILLFSANPVSLLTYEQNFADGIINKPFRFADLERKCYNLLPHKRTWFD